MKRLVGLVVIVVMVGLCVNVWAHNPKIATYQLKKVKGIWLLEVSFAQAGLHTAMVKHYGKPIDDLSEEEYQEKLVQYMRDKTFIAFDDENIMPEAAAVRLGSHQTDLKFVLDRMPQNPAELAVRLEALSENVGHQNVLRVFDQTKKARFILGDKTDYAAYLAFTDQDILQVEKPVSIDFRLVSIVLGGVLLLGFFFWLKRKPLFKVLKFSGVNLIVLIVLASCGDDDENPTSGFTAEVSVAASDAIGKEGDNDAGFTISLSKQNTSGEAITIPFALSGTATEGDDFNSLNRTVSIASGQTSALVAIKVIDDTEEESNETVILTLGTLPDGITGLTNAATVTLEDNDATTTETYKLTIEGTTTVSEGSAEAVFTIKLDKANDTGAGITVSYTIGGTVSAGDDYTAPSGSATIGAGETQVDVSIPLLDDAIDESNETVIISLSGTGLLSNVSLGAASELTITITDNDDSGTAEDVTITFGSIFGNSITIDSWTDISADNYIIVINNTDAFTDLTDGSNPDYSTTYNGYGEQVVYNGVGISTFAITLLETSTSYYFKVFPFEDGVVDNSQARQTESTVSCATSSTTQNEVCFEISSDLRTISSNQYPNHATGSFPNGDVTAIALSVSIDLTPVQAGSVTYVYNETGGPGPSNKNFYRFGVASNGLGYNPMGLKPWENPDTGEQNWQWQAKVTDQGETHLDAYGGHVTSDGKYHYHGDIVGLADEDGSRQSRVYGFAADGFPIYYKYGYSDPNDHTSAIVELESSYQLKSGSRPGDGITAPDGTYDGTYIQDYEYVNGLGDLDECNGRTGITPEYPDGTYYYVITSEFPKIPNCFVGTPDIGDFGI